MKTLLKISLPILVLLVSAFGAKALIDSKEEVVPEPPAIVVPTVRTLIAERSSYGITIPTRGTIVPRTESDLMSQVAGRVTAVSPALVAGGFFEKGEVLVELESRDYELALAQSNLSVAQAERRLAEEKADADVARREWEQLGEGEPNALTLREPQVKEAEAALAAAQAGHARAELDVERTILRASFAGRVRSKQVDLGQYVMPGAVLARVYAVDYAEVRLPLSDTELAFVDLPVSFRDSAADAEGPLVQLSANFAGAQHQWSARIVRTEGEIDPTTRMVMAVARVEDPYGRTAARSDRALPLTIGMFVEAEIRGHDLHDVFVLPRSALRDGEQLFVVVDFMSVLTPTLEVVRTAIQSVFASSRLAPQGSEGSTAAEEMDVLILVDVEVLRATRDEIVLRCTTLVDGARVITSPMEIVTKGMQVLDLAVDAATEELAE